MSKGNIRIDITVNDKELIQLTKTLSDTEKKAIDSSKGIDELDKNTKKIESEKAKKLSDELNRTSDNAEKSAKDVSVLKGNVSDLGSETQKIDNAKFKETGTESLKSSDSVKELGKQTENVKMKLSDISSDTIKKVTDDANNADKHMIPLTEDTERFKNKLREIETQKLKDTSDQSKLAESEVKKLSYSVNTTSENLKKVDSKYIKETASDSEKAEKNVKPLTYSVENLKKSLDKTDSKHIKEVGSESKNAQSSVEPLKKSVEQTEESLKKVDSKPIKEIKEEASGADTPTKTLNKNIFEMATALLAVKTATIAFDMLNRSLDGAIKRFDTMQNYPHTLEILGFSAEQSSESVNQLAKGIEGLPTALNEVVDTSQRMVVMTNNIERSTQATLALNNAFLANNSDTDKAKRGLEQYLNMLSTGEVNLVSWRTLQETMGLALRKTAEEMGYTGATAENDLYKALRDGEVVFSDFEDGLIRVATGTGEVAEIAQTGAVGIETSFKNLQTAFTKGLANTITELDNALEHATGYNIAETIDATKAVVDNAFAVMRGAISATTPVLDIFAGVVKVTIRVVNALSPVIYGLVAAYATMKIIDTINKMLNDENTLLGRTVGATKEKTESVKRLVASLAENVKAEYDRQMSLKTSEQLERSYSDVIKNSVTRLKELTKNAIENAKAFMNRSKNVDDSKKGDVDFQVNIKDFVTKLKDLTKNTFENAKAFVNRSKNLAMAKQEEIASITVSQLHAGVNAVLTVSMKALTMAVQGLIATLGPLAIGIGTVVAAKKLWSLMTETQNKEGKKLLATTEEEISASEDLNKSVQSGIKARKENIDAVSREREETQLLADEINTLVAKESLSSSEKEKLKNAVEQLNEKYADLNLKLDEETNKINMSADALKYKLDIYAKQEKAKAITDELTESIKEQHKVENQIDEIVQKRKQLDNAYENNKIKGRDYRKTVKELEEQEEELRETSSSLAREQAKLSARYKESATEVSSATLEMQQAVKSEVEELARLNSEQEKTSATKKRMVEIVNDLNGAYDDLNLSIDEQTGKVSVSNEEFQNRVDVLGKAYEAQALYEANVKDFIKTEELWKKTKEELTEVQKLSDEALAEGGEEQFRYLGRLMELTGMERQYAEALAQKRDTFVESSEQIMLLNEEVTQALKDGVFQQEVAFEELSELQQSVIEDMRTAYQKYVDVVRDGNKAIDTSNSLSVEQWKQTMEQNQQILDEWADNVDALTNRVSQEMLEYVKQLGPEHAGLVNEMVNMSDAELQNLEETYGRNAEVAKKAAEAGLDLESLPVNAGEMITESDRTMQQKINDANFEDIGKQMIDKLIVGMDEAEPYLKQSAIKSVEQTETETGIAIERSKFDIKGKATQEKMAKGIKKGAEEPVKQAEKSVEQVSKATDDAIKRANFEKNGTFIPEGVAKGVKKNTKVATKSVDNMANSTLDQFKTSIDSHSPSKKFIAMAHEIPNGVAVGINDNTRVVLDAIQNMTNSMMNMFNQFIQNMRTVGHNAMVELANGINGASHYPIEANRYVIRQMEIDSNPNISYQPGRKQRRDLPLYAESGENTNARAFNVTPEMALGIDNISSTPYTQTVIYNNNTENKNYSEMFKGAIFNWHNKADIKKTMEEMAFRLEIDRGGLT